MNLSRRELLKYGGWASVGMAAAGCFPELAAAQTGGPVALALCIGLNKVDPNHYQGWSGLLEGCIPDAKDMRDIAHSKNYLVHQLFDEAATRREVQFWITEAARLLKNGDIFLVTYSGHGGQVPDTNGDEPDDRKDETWCLFDGQLIDDELSKLWTNFKKGVRIVVLSDSCHSGSVTRFLEYQRFAAEAVHQTGEHAIASYKPAPGKGPQTKEAVKKEAGDKLTKRIKNYATRAKNKTIQDDQPSPIRAMPDWVEAVMNAKHGKSYKKYQDEAGSEKASRDNTQATVILISGCQDNQTSGDGPSNGLFTGALKQVWANDAFVGNYKDFQLAIQQRLHGVQSPNYFVIGAQNRPFENQRPFAVV